MAEEIKVKLTLDSNVGAKMKKAAAATEKGSKKMEKSAKAASSAFKTLAAAAGGLFVFSKVAGFMKENARLADVQAKSEAALTTALGKQSIALQTYASELQKVTLFGDEETIAATARLAAFVKEEKELKRIIPLVQDFATAKGMDLASAAELVGKSLGSSTNALTRYGIEVEGAVGSTERVNTLLENMATQVKGAAEAAALAGSGPITQLSNDFGDLREKIGQGILTSDAFTLAIKKTRQAVVFLSEVFTDSSLAAKSLSELEQELTDRTDAHRVAMELLNFAGASATDQMIERVAQTKSEVFEVQELIDRRKEEIKVDRTQTEEFVANTNKKKTAVAELAKIQTIFTTGHTKQFQEAVKADIKANAERSQALIDNWHMMAAEKQRLQELEEQNRQMMFEQNVMGAAGLATDIAGINKDASLKNFRLFKAFATSEAIIATALGATKALPNPFAVALAIGAGGVQVARIQKMQPPAFAKGADFETRGPQVIEVGDNPGGRERVQVTPLSSPNINGPSGGGVNITIQDTIVVQGNADENAIAGIGATREQQNENLYNQLVELQAMGRIPA